MHSFLERHRSRTARRRTVARRTAGRRTAGRRTAKRRTAKRRTAKRRTAGRRTAGRRTAGRRTANAELPRTGAHSSEKATVNALVKCLTIGRKLCELFPPKYDGTLDAEADEAQRKSARHALLRQAVRRPPFCVKQFCIHPSASAVLRQAVLRQALLRPPFCVRSSASSSSTKIPS